MKLKKILFLFTICFLNLNSIFVFAAEAPGGSVRGIDFRMQFDTGTLDFTNISGIKRKFSGVGSELQTSVYLIEKGWFRTSVFIGSRVMSWSGQNVQLGEYDDIQTFAVSPGLEIGLGPFFIQAASQKMNANSYYISSTSLGKQFNISGQSIAAGINYKFNHLGLGLGVTKMNFAIPGELLDLSSPSQYSELSYSLNLIYYMGITPGTFFHGL